MYMPICYIFLFSCSSIFGQDYCLNSNLTKQELIIKKAERKNKIYAAKYSQISFNIAECYRQKNDTNYIFWYKKSVEINKGLYIHYKNNDDKLNSLKVCAFSYYYSNQYLEAIVSFEKCLKFCRDLELNHNEYLYYLADCQLRLAQYENAIKTFKEYKSTNDNKHNVDESIKICENKISIK